MIWCVFSLPPAVIPCHRHSFVCGRALLVFLFQEDLINEINIMKQCQSEYIVSYFGSYFKDNDLWVPDAPLSSL
jgi:hypothetical protein